MTIEVVKKQLAQTEALIAECERIRNTLPAEFHARADGQLGMAGDMQAHVVTFLNLEVKRLESLQRICFIQQPTQGSA